MNRIKVLRKEAGLTQAELAKKIGVSDASINKYEKGIMSPKIDFVFKLIFGDEKNKEILIAFLSDVLRLPKKEFKNIELLNTELIKEFKDRF